MVSSPLRYMSLLPGSGHDLQKTLESRDSNYAHFLECSGSQPQKQIFTGQPHRSIANLLLTLRMPRKRGPELA